MQCTSAQTTKLLDLRLDFFTIKHNRFVFWVRAFLWRSGSGRNSTWNSWCWNVGKRERVIIKRPELLLEKNINCSLCSVEFGNKDIYLSIIIQN
jgi:hypothetical protein